jgi:tryptophan synthase alpha subunit
MSRLSRLFDECRAEGRSALIGYLPTGFPDVPTSISAMTAMVESGCDIIEVGIAYSDPGMDGPVIAAATEAALRGGVRVRDALAAVEAISKAGGRAVVMTYWNPVLRWPTSGWPYPMPAIWTGSSWWHRRRRRSGWRQLFRRRADSYTPLRQWA